MTHVKLGRRAQGQGRTSKKGTERPPVERGFTLIELLVVVSIIALLISILVPSLSKARSQAKLLKCVAHQRGLGQAGFAFAQDHRGLFQLVTNSVGVGLADASKSKFEYTSSGELTLWPVAMAQASGVKLTENWQWSSWNR